MKLKYALLLMSAVSSSVYAKSYNLNTVINESNINKIVSEMVKNFRKGNVDPSFPIGVSGTYDLDDDNKLIALNVNHAVFKVVNIPLVGSYKTDVSVSATFEAGKCDIILTSASTVNSGDPSWVNPIFASDLASKRGDAISILIKNSDLNKYCVNGTFRVFFY